MKVGGETEHFITSLERRRSMRTGALAEAPEKGVATTIKSLLKARAIDADLLKIRKTETDKRDLRLAIRNLDEALKATRSTHKVVAGTGQVDRQRAGTSTTSSPTGQWSGCVR